MEAVRNQRCSERVRQEFVRRYAFYLDLYPSFIPYEVEFREGLSRYKVSQPGSTKLKIYPAHPKNPGYDLRFNFSTEYMRCCEIDEISGDILPIPVPARFRLVESRAYHGIFRESLSQPPLIIAQELKKRRINFLAMVSYDGPLLKTELMAFLKDFEIATVFIKGLKALK